MIRRSSLILSAVYLALACPAAAAEQGATAHTPAETPTPSEPSAAGREEEAKPEAAATDGSAAEEAREAPAGAQLGIPERTDPAASRGPSDCPARIQALAPASGVGRTAKASPVLYWSLDEATECRIEMVLNDPRAATPRIEREIPGPHAAGVHAIGLDAFGVQLEPGIAYSWYVQIVPDPGARSKDVFSGAAIERVAAGGGELWYDELAAHASRLASTPEDVVALESWRALLASQGLPGDARASERSVAAGPGR